MGPERRAGGVCCVEVRVERDRVVSVALQGAEAVVMCVTDVGVAQSVRDRLREHRVGADLNEGAVVGAGRGDGLAEPNRIAHVGHPVFGIERGLRIGAFDCADDRDARHLRHESGQICSQLGQDGVHHRVMGRYFHVHPAGKHVPFAGRSDDCLHRLDRTGHHRLPWRRIHRHRHPGVIGDQQLGCGGIEFQQGHRALVGELRHQLRPAGDHLQALGRRQRAGHNRGGDLTH